MPKKGELTLIIDTSEKMNDPVPETIPSVPETPLFQEADGDVRVSVTLL